MLQIAQCKDAIFGGKDIPGMPDDTAVGSAKMTKLIAMPFGLSTWVGPRNHVLDVDPDRPMPRGNF